MSQTTPEADGLASGYSKHFKRGDREYQRVYKACESCRKKKARCDLGGNQEGIFAFTGPPCARCRREHRECIFDESRSSVKRVKVTSHETSTASASKSQPQQTKSNRVQQPTLRSPQTHERDAETGRDIAITPANTYLSPGSREVRNTRFQDTSDSPLSRSRIADSFVRTVVSTGNDPLRILSEAAVESDGTFDDHSSSPDQSMDEINEEGIRTIRSVPPTASTPKQIHLLQINPVQEPTLYLWRRCKFVRMGLFSPEEGIAYVDAKNMSHLVPVLDDETLNHQNHSHLLSDEPLLITTILLISTRHHSLTGFGSKSRAQYVHSQLWTYTQRLILRLMTGQEKSTNSNLRSLASVEALMLLSEWYPQGINFAPDQHGWDSNLLDPEEPLVISLSSNRHQDMLDSAKRSDRMSWMLLGSAQTLAHELGVFSEHENCHDAVEKQQLQRRRKIRELLCIYVTLIAARLGISSMVPLTFSKMVLNKLGEPTTKSLGAWLELIKLAKSFSTVMFPSPVVTQDILRSGRYLELMEHFAPLINQWKQQYLDTIGASDALENLLFYEYYSVRIYLHSLAVQAIAERFLSQKDTPASKLTSNFSDTIEEDVDIAASHEVINDATAILHRTLSLAREDRLRFQPVRTFFRVISASFFLIKVIMLGIPNERDHKKDHLLALLRYTIGALKQSAVDDVHLPALHAILLERQLTRLNVLSKTRRHSKDHSGPEITNSIVHNLMDHQGHNITNESHQILNHEMVWQDVLQDPSASFDFNQELSMFTDDNFGFDANDLSFWSGFGDFNARVR